MIDAYEAGRILERLQGQWPGMAATDSAADDWMRAIRQTTDPHQVCDTLIEGWTRDRGPRVADWIETARQQAQRAALERRNARVLALDAPPPVGHEAVGALIEQARQALADGKRKRPVPRRMPVSKYDDLPVSWGEHLMTPEERQAELDAIGDRKIRKRRP